MRFTLPALTSLFALALATASIAQTTGGQTAPRLADLDAILARHNGAVGPATDAASDGICAPDWAATFGPAPGVDGTVHRGLVFDDGSGPALVVVGNFDSAGGQPARNVARWDGVRWSPMGQGLAASGHALVVHDDGSGPALYAGGNPAPAGGPSLARWNGVDWITVPFPGIGAIRSLASYDDSSGPALYAGGDFDLGSGAQRRIVRFDGTNWSAMLGAMIPTVVEDLAVHTDGGVTSLYLAFEGTATVGGQPSVGSLRWSSAGWSRILGQPVGRGYRLAVHDDGAGPELYCGGLGSGSPGHMLARLVNGAWVQALSTAPGTLRDLESIDLGAGPRLLLALQPQGGPTGSPVVMELMGGSLSTLVTDQVDATLQLNELVTFDAGTGPQLMVMGLFEANQGTVLNNVARVDANLWRPLGGNTNVDRPIEVAAAFGSGAARRWIAVRHRANASGNARPFVDAWDGNAWTSLGEATGPATPSVDMLQVLDDGNGERLYAGGRFFALGGVAANGIAVHDGVTWSALGAGVNGRALCSALFDAGQGEVLIVGGEFSSAGGVAVSRIASWDGATWSPLAGGGVQAVARALAVDKTTATPTLYVGGRFGFAGNNVTCNSIARWDSATWNNLGPGFTSFVFLGEVYDLALFDEGQGTRLFASGQFDLSPGTSGLARWDGTSWTAVGGASLSSAGGQRLLVHDDGTGRALYVGGAISAHGGSFVADGVTRWDGATWEALPGNSFAGVESLSVFDPGDGRALMCAGSFEHSPAGDAFVTRWRGCPAAIGEVYCTPAVPNSTGVGATLSALGSTLTAEGDVLLSAADLPQNSFGVFLGSLTRDLFPGYNGSQGTLCLGGAVGLFSRAGEVQNAGAAGAIELALDVASIPTPTGSVPAAPGDTWHFQAWYRDRGLLGATSNFTPGVSVGFE
jgi:hypothetical protein